MEVWVNADGTRNRDYRPYINGEEYYRNVPLYDPNGPGPNSGLYDRTQPMCMNWIDKMNQTRHGRNRTGHVLRPSAVITGDGRYILR